jgi:hypothetical protein
MFISNIISPKKEKERLNAFAFEMPYRMIVLKKRLMHDFI